MGGFLLAAAGYIGLSVAPNVWFASVALILAHAGGSATWMGSTGILQQLTEDKFRGRVFSAEFAFSTLLLSAVSFGSGVLSDAGVPVRVLALGTGIVMFAPFLLWVFAQRWWDDKRCDAGRM